MDGINNKYERLHEIASRDWFKSTSVSLAKLDAIKASVYNITPNKTQSLRPSSSSASRNRRGQSYTDLQVDPPLLHVGLQQSSWRNNPSVPNLIKQQGERQHGIASAKRPCRPWSGRKVPPSPTLQQRDKKEQKPDDNHKTFIAVTGSKYDPLSRPPSGRTNSSSEVALPGKVGDGMSKRAAENALDDFLRGQPDGDMRDLAKLSAAYAYEDTVTPPPPAPCASPDIHQMLYGDSEGYISDDEEMAERVRLARMKEVIVKQAPPPLLRRPTPEPVRLSMTIPVMGNISDEEEDDVNCESPTADMELQSISSEMSGNLEGLRSLSPMGDAHNLDTWTGGIKYVTLTSRHNTTPIALSDDITMVTGGTEGSDALNSDGNSKRGKHSQHVYKTHNDTLIETLQNAHNNEPLMPHPPPARRRPLSATASVSKGHAMSADRLSRYSVAQRPKSAKARSLKMATVAFDYETDGSDEEVKNGHMDSVDLARKESNIKKRPEIETMMSRMSLSDEDNEASSGAIKKTPEYNVQYSTTSAKTNFYKAATASTQATLTTKTIAFTDAGILESKTVSKIGQVSEKPFVGRMSLVSSVKQLRATEHDSKSESESHGMQGLHSAIRRPARNNASLTNIRLTERPVSRMCNRPGDEGNMSNTEASLQDSHTASKKISRPISAPVKRRSKDLVSERKTPSKITRRLKSAVMPQKQNYLEKSHIALQPSSQSMKGVIQPKKSASDRQRNMAAVKALRSGTLNKDKKYTGDVAFEETKRVIEYTPRKEESSESSSEEEIEIPMSEQDKQMEEIHERLLVKGVNVSAKTLARGLLPPPQREYDECSSQLPLKSSNTLLSHPEAWLGEVFKKYEMAEKALYHANARMTAQSELEAKLAARHALIASKTKKKRKKCKKKKTKKNTSQSSYGADVTHLARIPDSSAP